MTRIWGKVKTIIPSVEDLLANWRPLDYLVIVIFWLLQKIIGCLFCIYVIIDYCSLPNKAEINSMIQCPNKIDPVSTSFPQP